MLSSNFAKRLTVLISTVAFIAIFASSCHRGSGCPGQITDRPVEASEIIADTDC